MAETTKTMSLAKRVSFHSPHVRGRRVSDGGGEDNNGLGMPVGGGILRKAESTTDVVAFGDAKDPHYEKQYFHRLVARLMGDDLVGRDAAASRRRASVNELGGGHEAGVDVKADKKKSSKLRRRKSDAVTSFSQAKPETARSGSSPLEVIGFRPAMHSKAPAALTRATSDYGISSSASTIVDAVTNGEQGKHARRKTMTQKLISRVEMAKVEARNGSSHLTSSLNEIMCLGLELENELLESEIDEEQQRDDSAKKQNGDTESLLERVYSAGQCQSDCESDDDFAFRLVMSLSLEKSALSDVESVPVGRGAYADVFRCKLYGATVAFKRIKQDEEDRSVSKSRLWGEATLLAQIRHPCVVQLMGVVVDAGIVLEYLDGGSLSRLIHGGGAHPLSANTVLAVARDVLLALNFLHHRQRPIVHLDVKTSNVLFDESQRAKLSDFGLARELASPSATLALPSGVVARGTPAYMAPEMISGEQVFAAADVYAFGMLLWEIMSGEKPYDGMLINEVLHSVVSGDHPKLAFEFDLRVPGISEVIGRCWSQTARDRPRAEHLLGSLSGLSSSLGRRSSLHASAHDLDALVQGVSVPLHLERRPSVSSNAGASPVMAWASNRAERRRSLAATDLVSPTTDRVKAVVARSVSVHAPIITEMEDISISSDA